MCSLLLLIPQCMARPLTGVSTGILDNEEVLSQRSKLYYRVVQVLWSRLHYLSEVKRSHLLLLYYERKLSAKK